MTMGSEFALLKTIHVLSATILFGTGLGTAFHLWMTHRGGDARAIAAAARNTVIADWLFTAPAAILQPVSGAGLIALAGYDPTESWLVAAYALYLLAGACWLVVVVLQLRVRRIAERCVREQSPLPSAYYRAMRAWFWLGWPAFLALIAVFWLMVAKPVLW
jgi:uncharacterized membrane protein